MKNRTFCRGCWEQMHVPIVIHGPFAAPYRLVGLRPSRMNPNLCTLCETMFKRIMKAANVRAPLTILFADVRGYTSMSESIDFPEVSRLLGRFYETCGEVIWKREGIVNKLIGDAVLAVFNFPLRREDHAARAVDAAMELQQRCREMSLSVQDADGRTIPVGVGIGVHTGETLIGEVGDSFRDFTVLGPVVNLTARLQGAARPGEIIVTEDVIAQAPQFEHMGERREFNLKGIDGPTAAYVIPSPAEVSAP